jgi:hypothetical protein
MVPQDPTHHLAPLSQFRNWLSQSQAVSCNITFPQHDPSLTQHFREKRKNCKRKGCTLFTDQIGRWIFIENNAENNVTSERITSAYGSDTSHVTLMSRVNALVWSKTVDLVPRESTLYSLVETACIYTARFNIQQFYVLPTQCIYVFCVDLRTNSDYFAIQH